MTDESDGPTGSPGWFAGLGPGDVDAAADRIREGGAERPADWPTLAVESGFADGREGYDEALKAATTAAARQVIEEREGADDRQLVHAVSAMDDLERVVNELGERLVEWATSRGTDADGPVETARAIAEDPTAGEGDTGGDSVAGKGEDPEAADPADDSDYPRATRDPEAADPAGERLHGLAERVLSLAEERDATRAFVERAAPAVAPNLAALAGPVLAARLIALAGDLESLAKMPAGTVQVLGAEDALFAHLRGDAPSPKHGVIYTHEYVRNTVRGERGSAARALAGKLAIAARVDHYSGDRRPELDRELDERIARIRSRGESDG